MDKIHFEWKKEYSVGVDEIDRQHKKMIKIIDGLYQSITGNGSEDIVEKTMDKLGKYAKHHFDTEEKYFKKFGYKFSGKHSVEHENFKSEISGMAKMAKSGELGELELLFYLENWWINHIINSDKKYMDLFKRKGLR